MRIDIHGHRGRFAKRALALLAVTAATITAGQVLTSAPAMALGAGQVCVFEAPNSTYGLGHTGWAFFEPGANRWWFGATENPSGKAFHSGYNGAWVHTGSWNDVLSTFANDLWEPAPAGADLTGINPGNIVVSGGVTYVRVHPANYYLDYRCKSTPTSAVGAAAGQATNNQGAGYGVVYNNCLDQTVSVLQAYRGDAVISPNTDLGTEADPLWIPNVYFLRGLDMAGFGAVNAVSAPSAVVHVPAHLYGVVQADPDVALRSGPSASFPQIARIPLGHLGPVLCYATGDTVTGWGGTNSYWDKINVDGNTGYIADVWLNTGGDITTQTMACSGSTYLAPSVMVLDSNSPTCPGSQEYFDAADLSGTPIEWTYANGSSPCIQVTWDPVTTGAFCTFDFYVPNGYATANIRFDIWYLAAPDVAKVRTVYLDENPVTGWQRAFSGANILTVIVQDDNGQAYPTQIGWGSTRADSLRQNC